LSQDGSDGGRCICLGSQGRLTVKASSESSWSNTMPSVVQWKYVSLLISVRAGGSSSWSIEGGGSGGGRNVYGGLGMEWSK
jgi:hypothetical protein